MAMTPTAVGLWPVVGSTPRTTCTSGTPAMRSRERYSKPAARNPSTMEEAYGARMEAAIAERATRRDDTGRDVVVRGGVGRVALAPLAAAVLACAARAPAG